VLSDEIPKKKKELEGEKMERIWEGEVQVGLRLSG
jgi:hypothetical protein